MSNDGLVITIEDKINAAEVFGDTTPAIIVEGKTDILVYSKILTKIDLDWSFIDIINGNGKTNILKHHNMGISFENIIILDADYDKHRGTCLNSPNIIYTHHYTVENYLLSPEIIEDTISRLITIYNPQLSYEELMDEILESINPLVLACVEKFNNNWEIKLEDYKIEHWLYKEELKVNQDKLKEHILKELSYKGLELTDIDWDSLETKKEQLFHSEINVLDFITGKRLYEALFYQLSDKFPDLMGMNKYGFFNDLLGRIFLNPVIDDFITEVRIAMQQTFSGDVLVS